MHRAFKWIGGGLLAVAGLSVVAWLGVPPLLKSQVEQHASAALGRPVTVGRFDFRPWTLELTAEQITVGAAAGAPSAEPLLRIARIHADADMRSVLNLAPVLTALEIDQPEIRLTRTSDGHYDIDDLIARFGTPAPASPDTPPARFALHNLQLRGGAVTFNDQPLQREHRLTALTLAVPFLSNLPAAIETEVTPRLAFQLDGTRFDSDAKARPFAAQHPAQARFTLNGFDLAPWLGYWPQALPVKLQRGRVSSELALHFEAPPQQPPALRLSGRVNAEDLALTDRAGQALLSWHALEVALRDVQPLARRVTLGGVTLDGLVLDASRDAQGRLNLLQLAGPASPPPATAASAAAGAASAAPAWQLRLDALALQNTRLHWGDAGTQPAAALTLAGLDLQTGPVQWPLAEPVTLQLNATLHGATADGPALGRLGAQGQAGERSAQVDLQIERLALAALQPYLDATLRPRVGGTLSASGQLRWSAAGEQGPEQLRLDLPQATVEALQLTDRTAGPASPAALATLQALRLDGAAIDLNAHTVALDRVQLDRLDTRLARNAQGEWNVLQWAVPQPPGPPASPPWQVTLKDAQLRDSRLQFADAQATTPVQLDIAQLTAGVQNLVLRGERLLTPLRWQLGAQVAAAAPTATRPRKAPAGTLRTLDGRGELGLAPLRVTSSLKVQDFPVHALEPYFGEALGLSLLRAHLGYQGELAVQEAPAGLNVTLKGDGRIGDLQLHTRRTAQNAGDELLRWQALTLQGLDVALRPPQKPRVVVGLLDLNDFYSKLVITEDGRFNLQDVGPAPAPAASSASASAPATPASAPVPAAELPVDLTLTATRLRNGRVDFTDRFIRPNYSADLSELQGTLGTLRTGTREMAEITLRGKVARTGTLDLSGQLNPTARPPVLDLRARAADLELTPLSPYAGKYAGYGIERGKLTMDVAYRITPEGQLAATNKLVLNQLTFGERVDSPSATQLPVLLAVALLKDRNGVIDLDLPIGGSLNDPQFSVFGLVLKVIGNVLTKAITAPFSLLSGGGGDDLSVVTFEPGTAALTSEGQAALAKVAQALLDRPALKLTLTGHADGLVERSAYQRATVEQQVQALWRQEREKDGASPEDAAAAVPTPADRTRLLDTLRRQAASATGAAGVAARPAAKASAPAAAASRPAEADPAAALADAVPVSPDTWRDLATRRAQAVRDALLARQLPNERLFLAAPKTQSDASSGKPRAELTLSAN